MPSRVETLPSASDTIPDGIAAKATEVRIEHRQGPHRLQSPLQWHCLLGKHGKTGLACLPMGRDNHAISPSCTLGRSVFKWLVIGLL